MPDLKPCPFCGCKKYLSISHTANYWITCDNSYCQAEGPIRKTEAEAIGAWNHRPLRATVGGTRK